VQTHRKRFATLCTFAIYDWLLRNLDEIYTSLGHPIWYILAVASDVTEYIVASHLARAQGTLYLGAHSDSIVWSDC
jgi:hypothetical protein